MKMIEKRTFVASVALDQSTLWIVGGFNGCVVNNTTNANNILSSTEFSQWTRFAIYNQWTLHDKV